MYELMQNSSATMNHLEIAELVKSRDDKVKQSIDRLVARDVIIQPPVGIVQSIDTMGRNRETQVYTFSGEKGKRDSLIVVAQLSPEFTGAIVDRWIELERQTRQPAQQLPTNYIEALEQLIVKEKALIAAQPKINHYDAVVERGTLLNATTVAQSVGIKSATALNRILDTMGVYNLACKRGRAFRGWFVEQGLGDMKQGSTGHNQPLFTTKGQAWIVEKLGGAK